VYPSKWLLAPTFFSLLLLAACNQGLGNPVDNGGGGGGKGGGGKGGGGGGNSPAPVTVSAGSTTTGVDIAVVSAKSSPTPNAQFLGVNIGPGVAAETGDTVSRSQGSATVTMYGPGLATTLTVTITGPSDITVGPLSSITATDGTPGVQFPITLTGLTALGARTIVMKDAKGDITTFSGGLEVLP
jgi:hypothetical protein